MIHRIGEKRPQIASSCFTAWNCEIAGEVELGEDSSVWFAATLRGDEAAIKIGAGSNIQDGVVVHADPGQPCLIGKNCTVGHGAILHACVIGDDCLVGMGAIILSGVRIGPGSIVAAGALVTQGKCFPPGRLIMGSPAVDTKDIGPAVLASIQKSALHYRQAAAQAKREYLPLEESSPR